MAVEPSTREPFAWLSGLRMRLESSDQRSDIRQMWLGGPALFAAAGLPAKVAEAAATGQPHAVSLVFAANERDMFPVRRNFTLLLDEDSTSTGRNSTSDSRQGKSTARCGLLSVEGLVTVRTLRSAA